MSAKACGFGKAPDRFDEIAIGLGVARNRAAERRNDVEGIEIVERIEARARRRSKIRDRRTGPRAAARDRTRASATSIRGTLRMPNAMVQASKPRSGNGRLSALPAANVTLPSSPRSRGALAPDRRACPRLMSQTVTWVPAPPACAIRNAMSPVPPATSITANGRVVPRRVHRRRPGCPSRRGGGRPTSGRSSDRSGARPCRKTSSTIACLSSRSTVRKPKWVSRWACGAPFVAGMALFLCSAGP